MSNLAILHDARQRAKTDDAHALAELKGKLEYSEKKGNGEPKLIDGLRNIAQILRYHPALKNAIRYDEFRRRKIKVHSLPWCAGIEPWRDVDTHAFRDWLQGEFKLKSSNENAASAIDLVAYEQKFDSLQDHVASLAHDGVSRVESLLSRYFGAEDSELHREFSKRFLVQMVARAMRPGCKADVVLVLEGRQGARKSSGLRALAGVDFYSDDPLDFSSKDGMQAITETWLHEIAELDSFKRQEMTIVKAFLTKQRDKFRPPYGREIVDCDRRCVFAATTNESVYADDSTGNRRFWPVACGDVDVDAIVRDRDQLIAEARIMFESGQIWWIDASDAIHELVLESQSSRNYDHPWKDQIQKWLVEQPAIDVENGFTPNELIENAIGLDRQKIGKREFMILGDVMRSIGWSRSKNQVLRQKIRTRVYLPQPEFLGSKSAPAPTSAPTIELSKSIDDFSDLDDQIGGF